jgi:hypothetical protein
LKELQDIQSMGYDKLQFEHCSALKPSSIYADTVYPLKYQTIQSGSSFPDFMSLSAIVRGIPKGLVKKQNCLTDFDPIKLIVFIDGVFPTKKSV